MSDLELKIYFVRSVTEPAKENENLGVTYYLHSITIHPRTKNIRKCKDITKTISLIIFIRLILPFFLRMLETYNFVSNFNQFGRNHIKEMHRYLGTLRKEII